MPLATGIYVHACLAEILLHVQAAQAVNPGHIIDLDKPEFRVVVRSIIRKQVDEYRALVKARGWLNIEGKEEVLYVIEEQCCLVEGLIWGWTKVMLPTIVKEYEIVDVEEEELYIINKEEAKPEDAIPNEIAMMCRPDILLRMKRNNTLGLHDFKTTATVSQAWIDEWRHSVQTASYTHAVESRLNIPVPYYYIHAIIKGQRRAEYNSLTKEYDGPKRQNSMFCYAYFRAPNPPFVGIDYQPKFKYKDVLGKNHNLGKEYIKLPVWQMPFMDKPKEFTISEWWVEKLAKNHPEILWEQFSLIGPYERQDHLIKSYIKEMAAEERRWTVKLWKAYDAAQEFGEGSPEHEDVLAEEMPRSWACSHYGAPCPYVPLCFKHVGWEDPIGGGLYVARRPHHDLEIAQMRERGIEPPPLEVGEDEQ